MEKLSEFACARKVKKWDTERVTAIYIYIERERERESLADVVVDK